MSSYDTPDASVVLQEDPPEVPVKFEGVVQTQEMPCETFFRSYLLPTGSPSGAEKVLNADARRKVVRFWWIGLASGVTGVCISNTQGDTEAFRGALLFNNLGISIYEFGTRGEVWAKPFIINNTGGTFNGFTVTTDDVFLCAEVEQWAR